MNAGVAALAQDPGAVARVEVAAALWNALMEDGRSALRNAIVTELDAAGYPGARVEHIGAATEADADPLRIVVGDRILRPSVPARARALSVALREPLGSAHAGDAWRRAAADPSVCRESCCAMAAQMLRARTASVAAPEEVDSVVSVRLAESYLRELSLDDGELSFASFRKAAVAQTGIDVEHITFEIAGDMPHGMFSFRIGGDELAPWIGLAAGTRLASISSSDDGRSAYHPVSGEAHTIVEHEGADSRGDATSGLAYVAFALEATLREESARLVSVNLARRYVESIRADAPDVYALFRIQYSPETLAQVLRLLLVEGVGVRDARTVIDAMLDYAEAPMQPPQLIVIDDRLPVTTRSNVPDASRLTAFVRTRLKRALSNMYGARGRMSVYMLDSALDNAIATSQPNDRVVADQLLRATAPIGMELTGFEVTPPLLVSVEARARVREMLSELYPRWPVIAFQELVPDVSIKPLSLAREPPAPE